MSDGNKFLKGFFTAGVDSIKAEKEAQAKQDEIRAQEVGAWRRIVYTTQADFEKQKRQQEHDLNMKTYEAEQKAELTRKALESVQGFDYGGGITATSKQPTAVTSPQAPTNAYKVPEEYKQHPYANEFIQLAQNAGADENLTLYMLNHESSFGEPLKESKVGAQSAAQVMPATQKDPGYGVKPAQNDSLEEKHRVGVEYLNAMKRVFGNERKALIAYNWGPENTMNWLKTTGGDESYLPEETKNYIKDWPGGQMADVVPIPGLGNQTMPAKIKNISDRLSSTRLKERVQGLQDMQSRAATNEIGLDVAGVKVDLQGPIKPKVDAAKLDYEERVKSEDAAKKTRDEFQTSIETLAKDKASGNLKSNPFWPSLSSEVAGTNYNAQSPIAKADYKMNLSLADDILNFALVKNPGANTKRTQKDVIDLLQEFNKAKGFSSTKSDPKRLADAEKNAKMIAESLGLGEEEIGYIRGQIMGEGTGTDLKTSVEPDRTVDITPTDETPPITYSDIDLEYTAKKHGISVEEVRKRLQNKKK